VRNFVATLMPVPAPDPLVRFETAAGDQMQVDWVEFRRRKGANLFAFVATLGYSRATSVEFVSDMRLDSLLKCHVNCFNWFGGVPRRALYVFTELRVTVGLPVRKLRLALLPQQRQRRTLTA